VILSSSLRLARSASAPAAGAGRPQGGWEAASSGSFQPVVVQVQRNSRGDGVNAGHQGSKAAAGWATWAMI
jgi:hypothetical protein